MKLVLVCTFLLFWSTAASAGEIQGLVRNAQGVAVSGAKVTVANQRDGAHWEATTGEDGVYSVAGLESGFYMVTVTAASGQQALRREVSVGQGSSTARADFQFAQAPAQPLSAAEELNPNIFVTRIDLNSVRTRLTIRRGADPKYVPEFRPEQNYFGAEFGAPLQQFEVIRPRPLAASWRGSAYGLHQNSALNARNFFNVGPLRASRSSSYDLTAGGPVISPNASLLLQFGQSFTSGLVNGNIVCRICGQNLAPQSDNPQVNAVIANLLKAFPDEPPNLLNGQLNSNAPRDIDSSNGLARLDLKPKPDTSLALRYSINDYSEVPFQIVAGQNPQTDLRTQGAHISVTQAYSPETIARFGFHFDRTKALLQPTRRFTELLAPLGITSVPDIDLRGDVANIGPGVFFPRRRIQNRFQLYSDFSRTLGRHALKAGWSTTRIQMNDLQSNDSRGTLLFAPDFDCKDPQSGEVRRCSSVENFLLGRPQTFTITVGNLYRGFRNWEHFFFVEDHIRLFPTFSLSLGLRYELMTAPSEVNGLTDVGFPTDKNNFAPRFGFAWNPGSGETTVRGAYGISYGTTFPVTYGMTRFNPPAVQVIQVSAPDFANLLAGVPQEPVEGGRSALNLLSPDLATPYSHQYTLSIERTLPWASTLRIAYIGMRSFKLLTLGEFNRARPVPGVPPTTKNIDDRRPDPRFFAIRMIESNSIAYYDAMQLSFQKRLTHGLTFRTTYTFGKNIDTGGDFTNTASIERPPEIGSPTCELCSRFSDQKGVSLFDTPHALSISYSYRLPFATRANGWKSALFGGWQVSGTTLFQSGIPFHLHTGSDAPGFGNVDGQVLDRPNISNPAVLGMSLDDPDTSIALLGADSCNRNSVPIRCSFFDNDIPVGGRGNIGFNTFRKDGTNNWNFAVGKVFRFPGGRERTLQFRAEFLNFLNHAQFAKPGVVIAIPTFGQITNTVNKGRQVQFSLRLNF